jgi:hypothetical protein
MNYITQLLGSVASYGLRADHASRELVGRVTDECALLVCKKTGMKYAFFANLKAEVLDNVLRGTLREPGTCLGETKCGIRCKKRTLFEYCEQHRDQELARESKKRRIDAYVSTTRPSRADAIGHARFVFF